MADEGTFATTAEIQRKVGANASSTANVEAYTNHFIKEAEAFINTYCNFDFRTAYSGLSAGKKEVLKKCASAMAAMSVINYDMTGFSRLLEAQTRLNVLQNEVDMCLKLLKDDTQKTFVGKT